MTMCPVRSSLASKVTTAAYLNAPGIRSTTDRNTGCILATAASMSARSFIETANLIEHVGVARKRRETTSF